LLEMVNSALNCKGHMCFHQWDFCCDRRPWLVKLGVNATDQRLYFQAICPLQKGYWLGGFQGVEPRSTGIALAISSVTCRQGKSLWLKASMVRKVSHTLFELYPGICLITEEKHGKPMSRVAK
jgi:hypothetical protein